MRPRPFARSAPSIPSTHRTPPSPSTDPIDLTPIYLSYRPPLHLGLLPQKREVLGQHLRRARGAVLAPRWPKHVASPPCSSPDARREMSTPGACSRKAAGGKVQRRARGNYFVRTPGGEVLVQSNVWSVAHLKRGRLGGQYQAGGQGGILQ